MDPNNMRGGRPTPARQAQPAPQQVRPAIQQPSPQKANKKKWLLPVAIVIIVALALGLLSWLRLIGPMSGVKADRYQAVFLTNDQVYFGKISSMSHDTITLKDVYYLKQQESTTDKDASDDTSSQKQVQLAKLGNGGEVHNPDNEMRLNRAQVLFWENMKDDSQVVKTINQNR